MELFENIAYEIGNVISKKNNPAYQTVNRYVDKQASNYLGQEIIAKVKSHANVATWSGVAGAVPGGVYAAGLALFASTWKMYYDINEVIGLSFQKISSRVWHPVSSAIWHQTLQDLPQDIRLPQLLGQYLLWEMLLVAWPRQQLIGHLFMPQLIAIFRFL